MTFTGWWFGTFFMFHFIYGMSSFPLTFICFKMGTLHHQPVEVASIHVDLAAKSQGAQGEVLGLWDSWDWAYWAD
jgi:uncharacterized membrane protein YccF (DUF307 family)